MNQTPQNKKPIENFTINFLGLIIFVACPILAYHISNFISKIFDLNNFANSLLNYFLWITLLGFCFYGFMLMSENKK